MAALTSSPSAAGGSHRGAWACLVSLSVVLAAIGGGSAKGGPADASCVYLALGCTTPTIHSIFDEVPPNMPETSAPDAAIDARGVRRLRRHAAASRHRHAASTKRLHEHVEAKHTSSKHVEPKPSQDGAS